MHNFFSRNEKGTKEQVELQNNTSASKSKKIITVMFCGNLNGCQESFTIINKDCESYKLWVHKNIISVDSCRSHSNTLFSLLLKQKEDVIGVLPIRSKNDIVDWQEHLSLSNKDYAKNHLVYWHDGKQEISSDNANIISLDLDRSDSEEVVHKIVEALNLEPGFSKVPSK